MSVIARNNRNSPMQPLDIGQPIKQVVHPIRGKVEDVRYDAAAKSFQYLVTYTDAQGEAAERWFNAAELEVDTESAPAAAAKKA